MTSPKIADDVQPGDPDPYPWHHSVAKHYNDEDATAPHHAGKNISVSPSGLTVVTTSDVQAALAEIDSTLATHAARHEPGGADAMAVDAAAGTGSLRTLGSGAQQAMAGDATPNSHGDGAHSVDYARGDGTLSVGQLAKIKTVSPLTLEGIDSGTYLTRHIEDVTLHGAVLDDTTDDSAAIQAAVNALNGERGQVLVPGHAFCDASIDVKRATIVGLGIPENGTVGGSMLRFSGTNGLSSSTEDSFGYMIRDILVRGSAVKTANGQTLVDFTGQNYPRVWNVRLQDSETGFLFASGSTIDCNYGVLLFTYVDRCLKGGHWQGTSRSHYVYGGRWQDNDRAVVIDSPENNIVFTVAFEGNDDAAVDSAGTDITFQGCRFENDTATNLRIAAGAGTHYANGNRWSSGTNLDDANSPTVLRGTDSIAGALHEPPNGTPLSVGTGGLEPHEGSPSVVAVDAGRYNGWSLPESGGIERLGGFLDVPDSWSTFDIELWHTHASGATDDAAMFVNLLQPSAGTDLGGTDHDSGTVAVTAVGTAGALGITTISSGVAAVGGATLLGLGRNSGGAADTLTSAFIVIAVVLRKAS